MFKKLFLSGNPSSSSQEAETLRIFSLGCGDGSEEKLWTLQFLIREPLEAGGEHWPLLMCVD